MTNTAQETLIEVKLALSRITDLEENVADLNKRLAAYDILAAKWGGMCMLAVGIGTVCVQFSDKIKAFLVTK